MPNEKQTQAAPLRVLHAAGEAVPWIKTGGLADVAGALPAAQNAQGDDARLLIPGYPAVIERLRARGPLQAVGPAFGPAFGAGRVQLLQAAVRSGVRGAVHAYVIDAPWLYDQTGGPYLRPDGTEWPDAPLRFGLLSWTAAQIAAGGLVPDWRPDVLHVHDWHAALAPVYLQARPGPIRPTVLTLHNVAFVGAFPRTWLAPLGLPEERFHHRDLEYWGQMSFLKGGVVNASALTTVSPTYATEIQSSPGGSGLEGVYRERQASLTGIVNGIDLQTWNHATDRLLAHRYPASDVASGKRANRQALMAQYDWPDGSDDGPLLVIVSRLTQQKGIDLVVEALRLMWSRPFKLFVLGSGDREIERMLRELAQAHPQRVRIELGFDEALAHRLYASADAVLVPSRFEPCGLSQMYAHRYGALPVVRRTGGLADTVHEAGAPGDEPGTVGEARPSNGFVFAQAQAHALCAALHRLLDLYAQPTRWAAWRQAAMAVDHGWEAPARAYRAVYDRVLHAPDAPDDRAGA